MPAAGAAGQNTGGNTGNVLPTSALADALTKTFESQQVDDLTSQGQPGVTGQPASGAEGAGAATETNQPSSTPGGEPTGEQSGAGSGEETSTGGEPTGELTEQPGEEELGGGPDGQPLGDEISPGAEKRIKRLLGQVRDLEERLERANGNAERTQEPTRPGPLDSVTDARALDIRAEQAEAGLEEAEMVLDLVRMQPERAEQYLRSHGVILQDEQGQQDFSPARMTEVLNQAKFGFRQTLRAIPKRRQYLEQFQKAHAQVVQAIPWVADRTDEKHALMQSIVAQFPGLKAAPNWEYWTACAIEGHVSLQANLKRRTAANGARTGAAGARPAARGPVTGANAGAAPRVRPDQAKVNSARQKVLKEGSKAALSEFFEATGFIKA